KPAGAGQAVQQILRDLDRHDEAPCTAPRAPPPLADLELLAPALLVCVCTAQPGDLVGGQGSRHVSERRYCQPPAGAWLSGLRHPGLERGPVRVPRAEDAGLQAAPIPTWAWAATLCRSLKVGIALDLQGPSPGLSRRRSRVRVPSLPPFRFAN